MNIYSTTVPEQDPGFHPVLSSCYSDTNVLVRGLVKAWGSWPQNLSTKQDRLSPHTKATFKRRTRTFFNHCTRTTPGVHQIWCTIQRKARNVVQKSLTPKIKRPNKVTCHHTQRLPSRGEHVHVFNHNQNKIQNSTKSLVGYADTRNADLVKGLRS